MLKCSNPDYPEFHEFFCACADCHTVWYCVEDPCQFCEGPIPEYCSAEMVMAQIEAICASEATYMEED